MGMAFIPQFSWALLVVVFRIDIKDFPLPALSVRRVNAKRQAPVPCNAQAPRSPVSVCAFQAASVRNSSVACSFNTYRTKRP